MGIKANKERIAAGKMGAPANKEGIWPGTLVEVEAKKDEKTGSQKFVLTVEISDSVDDAVMAGREVRIWMNLGWSSGQNQIGRLLMMAGADVDALPEDNEPSKQARAIKKLMAEIDAQQPEVQICVTYAWDKKNPGEVIKLDNGNPKTYEEIVYCERCLDEAAEEVTVDYSLFRFSEDFDGEIPGLEPKKEEKPAKPERKKTKSKPAAKPEPCPEEGEEEEGELSGDDDGLGL